ncbi:hypothetical protein HDU96_003275 [Phlyctochytrium bullatum]|nr:hypothetical protein HDU96_003275 [Phlyctochytrium bullatum]
MQERNVELDVASNQTTAGSTNDALDGTLPNERPGIWRDDTALALEAHIEDDEGQDNIALALEHIRQDEHAAEGQDGALEEEEEHIQQALNEDGSVAEDEGSEAHSNEDEGNVTVTLSSAEESSDDEDSTREVSYNNPLVSEPVIRKIYTTTLEHLAAKDPREVEDGLKKLQDFADEAQIAVGNLQMIAIFLNSQYDGGLRDILRSMGETKKYLGKNGVKNSVSSNTVTLLNQFEYLVTNATYFEAQFGKREDEEEAPWSNNVPLLFHEAW